MSVVEYLPFATDVAANVQGQSDYQASANRTEGFGNGIAPSAQFNKAWRQSSVMTAALANAISQALGIDVHDDGNVTALTANFNLYIQAIVLANLRLVLRMQFDSFATGGGGPYALTHPPSGVLTFVFFDGVEQPAANYIINSAGTQLSLAGGVNSSLFDTVRVVYAY